MINVLQCSAVALESNEILAVELYVPTEVDLIARHRTLRETTNVIVEFIESNFGDELRSIQQFLYDANQLTISILSSIKSSDIYTVVYFIAKSNNYNLSDVIDELLSLLYNVESTVDSLFAYFTGTTLV